MRYATRIRECIGGCGRGDYRTPKGITVALDENGFCRSCRTLGKPADPNIAARRQREGAEERIAALRAKARAVRDANR
jgi:hypothetical protein